MTVASENVLGEWLPRVGQVWIKNDATIIILECISNITDGDSFICDIKYRAASGGYRACLFKQWFSTAQRFDQIKEIIDVV